MCPNQRSIALYETHEASHAGEIWMCKAKGKHYQFYQIICVVEIAKILKEFQEVIQIILSDKWCK